MTQRTSGPMWDSRARGSRPLDRSSRNQCSQISASSHDMASREGGLGPAGCLLLAAILSISLQSSQAQFKFPPRTIVKGNSLYERLVAAGQKSPIIMTGVNDDPEVTNRAEARSTPSRKAVKKEEPSPPRRKLFGPRPKPAPVTEPAATRRPTIDLTSGQLPSIDVSRFPVDSGVLNVQGIDLHFAYALPDDSSADDLTFVLLHGANFNSDTWQKTGTLSTLAALGYNAIAVDLPGNGFSKSKSRGRLPSSADKAEFLSAVRQELGIGDQVVLVSPSLSGVFSVPLLLQQPQWLKGYVPVAPVGTDKITAEQARRIKVPTAIIYGSEDRGLGVESMKNLSNIRTSALGVIPGGSHPAYLDNPQLWHLMLHNFAKNLAKIAQQA